MASTIQRLLSELKRRKVTRVAVVYALVGIGVVEAAQLIFEALELPMAGWQILVILVLLGFPVALVLAWALEITPEGVRVTEPASPTEAAGSVTASRSGPRAHWGSIAGWALAGILVAYTAWQAFRPDDSASAVITAVATAAAVDDAADRGDWIEAYRLAMALGPEVPDSTREGLLATVSFPATQRSIPEGATVAWRPYGRSDVEWQTLGTTPHVWNAPRANVQVRYELDGYSPLTLAGRFPARLRPLDDILPNALQMGGAELDLTLHDARIAHAPTVTVGDYLMDQFEVTNREFFEFVSDGGYERRDLWEHALERGGEEIPWDEGVAAFIDLTGRPGPSTWSGGTYPEGTADHAVMGISWYEAAAYAKYVGRDLPTLYHWHAVAFPLQAQWVVPYSNYQGDGPAPVGQFTGRTSTGAADMAGNAREWLMNGAGPLRYTAGGGWTDPPYSFGLMQPQPPFDRSPTNGLRLMTNLGNRSGYEEASQPIDMVSRDFYEESQVSDEVFAAFLELYDYDDLPLNAQIEAVDTLNVGIRETITFDAGYETDRMILYLVRPLESRGPLQTVVYFPGSGALRNTGSAAGMAAGNQTISFLVRSGRAVVVPVYDGTFQRSDDYVYRLQDPSNEHRDKVLHWRQDLGRALDYLDTRADIDHGRYGYFGASWGGRMGAIMLAVEPRFEAAVLQIPGLAHVPTQPLVEPFNFVSRVTVPVLMLSGELDNIYPLETSAKPFFEFLGTPDEDKRHYIEAAGHGIASLALTRETLDWFDRYLGEIR